ncbi:cytochrome P450 (plasmid) [Streptomyces sp. NBC_01707]|uniref:cytochrome P450 n=1 Tax=Streptomyces sp. NBC_01707 TaxID=2975914 RepID=UPI002F915878
MTSDDALLEGVDPYGAQVLREPADTYAKIREAGPAVYSHDRKVWLVGRYDSASQVLRNYREFRSGLGAGYTRVPEHGNNYPLVDSDPPRHTRVRRSVQPEFGRESMEKLRPVVRAVAVGLVEAATVAGQIDAVSMFASRLPDLSTRLLTGVEPPDSLTMQAWSNAVGQLHGPNLDPRESDLAFQAFNWLSNEGVAMLPKHCMGHRIMEEGGTNGALADSERLTMLFSIWLAGIDSSSGLIGNAVNAFAEFPDQWDAVRADPRLIPNAVEELMRWDSPLRSVYRRTVAQVDVGGIVIPADADVCVLIPPANRDPRRFTEPDRLDISRVDAKAHLALGASIHLCVGAPLARMEAVEFLTALSRRVRRIERTGPAIRAASQTMSKFESLPVRLIAG